MVSQVNGPILANSSLFRYKNYAFGYNLKYNTQIDEKGKQPEFLDYNVGVGYLDKSWQVGDATRLRSHLTCLCQFSLSTTNCASSLTFSFLNTVSPSTELAARMDFSLVKSSQKLSIGSTTRVSGETVVKTKVDSNAIVSLSFSQLVAKVRQSWDV